MKDSMRYGTRSCPYCGAVALSEVCQFCGQYIGGTETKDLSVEYPTLECKNAELTFFGTVFPLIFMLAFGFFGFLFPVIFLLEDSFEPVILIACIPFAAVGIGAGVAFFRSVCRFLLVMVKGKQMTATVYGYMDDTVSYNGNNGQVVKLLIDTKRGKRFIFYPLGSTNKPYMVNSKIKIRAYGSSFIVQKETLRD